MGSLISNGTVDKFIGEKVSTGNAGNGDNFSGQRGDKTLWQNVDRFARGIYSFPRMIVPLTKILTRPDEDRVWIAKSPLLPGCHAHGDNRGDAILKFQQAAKVHLEALLKTGRVLQ